MAVVISLVKLRVDLAERMHEVVRGKGLSLEVQVGEEGLASLGEDLAPVESLASLVWVSLQSVFELVDTLEALDCRVHIAGVAQVL